jgi:hypothetical protein
LSNIDFFFVKQKIILQYVLLINEVGQSPFLLIP